MAEVEFHIGSLGPFFYDDSDTYPDGEPNAVIHSALGKGHLGGTPTENEEIVRIADLADVIGAYLGNIVCNNDVVICVDDDVIIL
ncbi:hypothetical protein LCGC14_1514680 [marine sediment metagenome]|uniref:Uncharacterized protein n=1 Tax=marine sediment metagenome TaxID=412755 RepID=A0A0F9M1I5_9ZZZZ